MVPGTESRTITINADGTWSPAPAGSVFPLPQTPARTDTAWTRTVWTTVQASPLPGSAPFPVSPAQPQPQTATQTTPAGWLVPALAQVAATTEKTAHVVAGLQITATSARADLTAIAQELARVEQKTARILEGIEDNVRGDVSLGDLLALLTPLLDLLLNQRDGGAYELSSPCEVDESGVPLEPREASYAGGYVIDNISSKVDAIAQLLQHHKDMKQPNCDGSELPSTNVTVQFTEVI